MKETILMLIWVLFGLVIAFDILLAGLVAFRGIQSRAWPTVEGTVNFFDVEVVMDVEGNLNTIKLRYSYEVGGVSYVSSRLHFGEHSILGHVPAWLAALEMRSDLKSGSHCKVYYNPGKPGLSTLIPGIRRESCLILLMLGWFYVWLPSDRPLLSHLI